MPPIRSTKQSKSAKGDVRASSTTSILSYFRATIGGHNQQAIQDSVVVPQNRKLLDSAGPPEIPQLAIVSGEQNHDTGVIVPKTVKPVAVNPSVEIKAWNDEKRRIRDGLKGTTFRASADGTMTQVSSHRVREDLMINQRTQISSQALPPVVFDDVERGAPVTTTMSFASNTSPPRVGILQTFASPVEKCLQSAVDYIQLVKSSQWPYTRCPEVLEQLSTRSTISLAEHLISGWMEHSHEIALHGKGWLDLAKTRLPETRRYGKAKGLYIDVLEVQEMEAVPRHLKGYGGMASGSGGLYDRTRHHNTPNFRHTHPSLHYNVMDREGTESDFRVFAIYPDDVPIGLSLLAEGHLIAVFGLYESPQFLRLAATLGMPAVDGNRQYPVLGLNNDAGLQHQGWDAQAAKDARDAKSRKRAMELVTTGFPVSLRSRNGITFGVLYGLSITIPRAMMQKYPTSISEHPNAVIFIDLSFEMPHHTPWYNIEPQDARLQGFGIWLQLSDITGFWLRADISVETVKNRGVGKTSSASSNKIFKVRELAEMIVEVYSHVE